jgi:hypothetical protein
MSLNLTALEQTIELYAPRARTPLRTLLVLDAASTGGRARVELGRLLAYRPAEVLLLWVIAPSEALSWAALAADSAEDRTRAIFVTLNEQMARARQRLAPLQRDLHAAGVEAQICVVHGPVVEAVARVVVDEQIDLALIAAQPSGVRREEMATLVERRTGCATAVLV